MLTNTKNPIALSFDVEDWFTVRNMRELIHDEDWDQQELRVDIGLQFILESLAKKNIKATFFVLGWIADRCPQVVHDIAHAEHEIASHGYSHKPIDLMTPHEFEVDLRRSIIAIETLTGKKVKGYRAPSFSITKKTAWALDIIKKCGLEYDSSVFSTIHPDYGISDFPTNITSIRGLLEVPLRKEHFFGTQVPVCGGGYFRMFPYPVIKSALNQTLKEAPVVMYFHPWEFDPGQPRMDLPTLKKFRHYVGLNGNQNKFSHLLDDFHFKKIEDLITDQKASRVDFQISNLGFEAPEIRSGIPSPSPIPELAFQWRHNQRARGSAHRQMQVSQKNIGFI